MNHFPWYCYDALLLSCFLTGCLLVRKSWPLEYQLLVVLSGLTFLVEGAAQCSSLLNVPKPWLYNLFLPVESSCIVYILYRASVHPAIKRLQVVLLVCLPIGIGLCYYLDPLFFKLNESAGLYGLFTELITACLFLIDALLNSSDTPLTRRPLFWMTAGLLYFCSNFILMHAFIKVITMKKIPYNYYMLNGLIANIFMYSGFIACFITLARRSPEKAPADALPSPAPVSP